MNSAIEQIVTYVERAILELLDVRNGLSEYELIYALRERGFAPFQRDAMASNLSLFQSHFLLFHILYRIDAQLRCEGSGWLDIHCLSIRRCFDDNATMSNTMPAPHDGLLAYYTNLDNLRDTSDCDVEAMLTAFWLRFVTPAERGAALSVLGLSDPVDDAAIEKQFRSMAQRLHPDRGGSTSAFQELSVAMRVLRR